MPLEIVMGVATVVGVATVRSKIPLANGVMGRGSCFLEDGSEDLEDEDLVDRKLGSSWSLRLESERGEGFRAQ